MLLDWILTTLIAAVLSLALIFPAAYSETEPPAPTVKPSDTAIALDEFRALGEPWSKDLISAIVRGDVLIITIDRDLTPEERESMRVAAQAVRDDLGLRAQSFLILHVGGGTLAYGSFD